MMTVFIQLIDFQTT